MGWEEFIYDLDEDELDALLVEEGIDPTLLLERGLQAVWRGLGGCIWAYLV